MPITWARSSLLALTTRIWVRVPIMTTMPSSTSAKVRNRPPNRVACPISARPTMLADTSIRKVVIRLRNSLWVVLRAASRLQCSVASSCARTLGGAPSVPCWLASDVAWPVDGAAASVGGGGTGLLDTRASQSQRGLLSSITGAIDPGYQLRMFTMGGDSYGCGSVEGSHHEA